MHISQSFFAAAFLTTSISSFALAEEPQPIRIGVMGPITGQQASNGEMMRDAINAFAKYTNDNGGIIGRPLEIKFYDDECRTEKAVDVANHVVADQVSLVIGPFCSGVTMPARDVFNESGIVNITPSQVDQVTGPGYPLLFRITPSNEVLSAGIIDALLETKTKKVAIFHVNDASGADIANKVERRLQESGIDVLRDAYLSGDQDFAAFATKINHLGADTVFLPGGVNDISRVARQLRENAYKGRIILPGTGTLPGYAQVVACPIIEGSTAIAADDKTFHPDNAYIIKAMKEAGTEPRDNMLFTWASAEVFQKAIEFTRSLDPQIVATAIRIGVFETPQGTLDFVNDGALAGNLVATKTARYMWKCEGNIPKLEKQ